MGWLQNLIVGWSNKTKARELNDFIQRLKSMDATEIGFVMAMATDVRHSIQSQLGWDLLNPSVIVSFDPMASYKMAKMIQNMQKTNAQPVAAGAMVWLHTLRASDTLDLRHEGRELWAQLERGFRYVDEANESYAELIGHHLNVLGSNMFPLGLTPEPLN